MGPEALTVHGLRQTALTRMAAAGMDAFALQAIAVHSSITTTQRYVHPPRETLQAPMAALGRSAASPPAVPLVPTKAPTAAVLPMPRRTVKERANR